MSVTPVSSVTATEAQWVEPRIFSTVHKDSVPGAPPQSDAYTPSSSAPPASYGPSRGIYT